MVDKVIVFGSEACGYGDPDLGFEILVNLLERLSHRDDVPLAIIFWNTSVNLLTEDSPVLTHLKRLEEKGVKIIAGKLCVNQLELTGKLAAGKESTMDEILDLVLHNDVINF